MELMKVNKHCMEDAHGTEYYRDEKGEWKPGEYRNGTFWWLRTRKFYARQRPYMMSDGKQYYYRLTRYTYKRGSHPAYAPFGKNGKQYKRARLETIKEVYYRHGRFYVACNIELDGKKHNSMRPYSGIIYDAHESQSEKAGIPIATIYVQDGMAYSIDVDGIRTDIAPEEWQQVAEWLQIKDVEPGMDEKLQPTDIIAAAEKIVEEEAARLQWIESTTTEGQQIDMFAYFGYGDNTWQELAYAGGR